MNTPRHAMQHDLAAGSAADASRAPAVTILVIAYRMPHTVAEAVRSALAQTLPCEIIVSDDSSGDGTFAAAQEAVRGYDGPHRVSVRSTQRNLGLCAHLMELAAIAGGEILVFQSGDDVAYPHRALTLRDSFVEHPALQAVGSAVDDIDANGNVMDKGVRGLPERLDQRWFLCRGKLQTVLGASMAVRRELLTALPPLQGVVEDNMLSLRAALIGECRCLPQALLGYRRHGNNLNDWMFDRSGNGFEIYERRNRRVLAMYRDVAADQERCVAALPDLPGERRELGLSIAQMYRLEADMREALIEKPRAQWLGPLWRGFRHPGLRRKSFERAFKLLLPRRWFGRG
ncbi:glycosyltransferase [Luteimonas sp. SX5]|uniref:Glycosyltransferase n=1 Tax=Luteimonas galliterrae TaxID=2940486 RepID=A0ABT0MLG0_9GAMM|nr:glycosyltransferase [Luteimonas galliterrae]MCL1635727.1 glycosyltransferase [Luteimonas galliterrae]